MKQLLFIFLFFCFDVFGHGEDKLGPHNGFIKMPGTFHVEVLKYKNLGFRIYLLDMSWENPTVADSSIEVTIRNRQSSMILKCEAKADSFLCIKQENDKLPNKGDLIIRAKRSGQIGNEVTYHLPLKL